MRICQNLGRRPDIPWFRVGRRYCIQDALTKSRLQLVLFATHFTHLSPTAVERRRRSRMTAILKAIYRSVDRVWPI